MWCKCKALLFTPTVKGAGNQERGLKILLTQGENNRVKDFLESIPWLPGHCGTAEHIQPWGHVRSTAPSGEASRRSFGVQITRKVWLSGKIKVVTLWQSLLHLRPGTWFLFRNTGRQMWDSQRHQRSMFQSSERARLGHGGSEVQLGQVALSSEFCGLACRSVYRQFIHYKPSSGWLEIEGVSYPWDSLEGAFPPWGSSLEGQFNIVVCW